jgi:hypothetical protein
VADVDVVASATAAIEGKVGVAHAPRHHRHDPRLRITEVTSAISVAVAEQVQVGSSSMTDRDQQGLDEFLA